MISTFLKCAFVAMTVSITHAQQEGHRVSARLVYFQQSPGDPEDLYFNNNGEFVKCSPSGSVSTPPVACPVDAAGKVLFTKSAAAGEVVAAANVPETVVEAVFLILKNPTPGAGAPYQILVIDESLKTLPKGGSFICNLSPKNARVSLGESKFRGIL